MLFQLLHASYSVRGAGGRPNAPWHRPAAGLNFAGMELNEVLAIIREARFSQGIQCPRCGSTDCHRWGLGRGRQRYRCRGCRRTFNDLTGTPAAFAKKLHLWPTYGACLHAAVTVRTAAWRTGVHPTTSFRWRHRLLSEMRARDGELLNGWAELVAAWFAHSEKGRRDLDRSPRLHGLAEPWPNARLGVNVVIAADRLGNVMTSTVGRANTRRPSSNELSEALDTRIEGLPILAADEGSYGVVSTYARRRGGVFHDSRARARHRHDHMTRLAQARAYRTRLLDWIERFRGVATHYLPNYLAWHRAYDRGLRQGITASVLRWPLASGFG